MLIMSRTTKYTIVLFLFSNLTIEPFWRGHYAAIVFPRKFDVQNKYEVWTSNFLGKTIKTLCLRQKGPIVFIVQG